MDHWIAGIRQGYVKPEPNRDGPLYRYAPNPNIMHCPADKHNHLRFTPNTGGPFCFDSYSGAHYLNGEGHDHTMCLFMRTEILHPTDRFIWIESSDTQRGENVCSWWFNLAGTQANGFQGSTFADAADAPGVFHVTAGCFNFCDGHAEAHRWANPSALNAYGNGSGIASAQLNNDALWVAQHWASRQNP